MVEMVTASLGEGAGKQFIEFDFKLAEKIKTLLNPESGVPLPESLLKGASVGVKLNLWSEFSNVLTDIISDPSNPVAELVAPVMGALPLYVCQIQGTLNIDVDVDQIKKVLGSSIGEIGNLTLAQLVLAMSRHGTFDDFEILKSILSDRFPELFEGKTTKEEIWA